MRTYVALLALTIFPSLASATVEYSLTPEPASKDVRVTVTLSDPQSTERFRIPAWTPGYYRILQYQDKIYDFKAVDADGKDLTVDHGSDPRLWKVSDPNGKPLTVSYRVIGDDPGLGFFATNVRSDTAYVNGASAFMFVENRLTETTHLQVKLPSGWKIATAADSDPAGGYRASGYDEMIDHPIQMGSFESRTFTDAGVPFEVVYVSPDGKFKQDLDSETARFKAVALPALHMFGSSSFKRYVFIVHFAVGNFGGGLEHRASDVLAISNTPRMVIDDLIAHEYFHAWNVKQIRPKVLGPFDYTKEQRTGNLWFAEGVTDYYANLTTYRSGLQGQDWLLGQLTGTVAELQRSRLRKQLTVADVSRQVWEHGGMSVGDLSYYTKGQLVGWILDAEIRDATHGAKSLDDVMRLMYERYKLPNPGYPEDGILKAVNEVSGKDFSNLYNKMVNSTDELPYGELKKIGLLVDPESWRVTLDAHATDEELKLRSEWLARD